MDLDDLQAMKKLDKSNYYEEIMNFPVHLKTGWDIGIFTSLHKSKHKD